MNGLLTLSTVLFFIGLTGALTSENSDVKSFMSWMAFITFILMCILGYSNVG